MFERCGAVRWDAIGRGGARGRAVRKTDDAHSRSGVYKATRTAGRLQCAIFDDEEGGAGTTENPNRGQRQPGSISYLLTTHPSHLWLSYLLFCRVLSLCPVLLRSCSRSRSCSRHSKQVLSFAALILFFSLIFDRLFYASHLPLPPLHPPSSEAAGVVPRPPTPSSGICTIYTIPPLETRSSYSR